MRRLQTASLQPAPTWIPVLSILAGLVALALVLAWVSAGFAGLDGWPSFLGILLVTSGLMWLAWRLLRAEALPGWLAGLLVGAALLRLLAGAVWFVALPVAGYGSRPEQNGYVMADAHERDRTAWDLAYSEKPIWKAFQGQRKADQYGGLLFLSILVYKVFGGPYHQPLLMVVLTAAFSSLAVVLVWAFARRAWDEKTAGAAAWLLALYPEAVLLGSSQMREAFLITLVVAAFYGLLRFAQERRGAGLAWLLGALFLCVPFSPPAAALLLAFLVLAAASIENLVFRDARAHRLRLWLILGGLGILVLAGLWITLRQFAPGHISDPLSLLTYWIRKSADWQVYLTRRASGWIQKLFANTPKALHLPLLIGYGILQPFLPAAVGDTTGAPVWRAIQIWRSLGWTLLLPFLAYAAWRALAGRRVSWLTRSLVLSAWLSMFIAAFRAGADPWDNPRYRAAFAGLQIALVAWAWLEQRRTHDPWFRRMLIAVVSVLAWFVPWYLRRYIHLDWPVVDVLKTIGLGAATAVLLIAWDWAREKKIKKGGKNG